MLVNRPIETDKILFCSAEKRWKCSRIVSRNSQSFALMNANTTRILLSWNNNLHRFSVTFHPCFVSRGSLSLFAVEHKKMSWGIWARSGFSSRDEKCWYCSAQLNCNIHYNSSSVLSSGTPFTLDVDIKHANKKTFNDETKDFCLLLKINFAWADAWLRRTFQVSISHFHFLWNSSRFIETLIGSFKHFASLFYLI